MRGEVHDGFVGGGGGAWGGLGHSDGRFDRWWMSRIVQEIVMLVETYLRQRKPKAISIDDY